jgi:ferritin-like metal-binding protein YciE
MSAPEDLKDLYVDELKDLYSANDQMQRTVKKLVGRAKDEQLIELLNRSLEGIPRHTETLKGLIEAQEGKVSKEHCKGMEGLVEEANKHTSGEDAPKKGPVRDAQIIAQYQRMSHYGLAGFGTAAAYATALGLKEDARQLQQATKEIYLGDEFGTKLAETSVNLQARDED